MTIRKTKLVVLASFLLLLSSLLILSSSTNAQKRRTGGTPRAAQPAAQFKTCSVCNGSGKTHEHIAKYEEVRCSNCAAKGETICDSSYGRPHYSKINKFSGEYDVCSTCNGTGRMRCRVCRGSGTRSVDRGYDVTKVCQTCKGGGRIQLTREEIRANEEAARLEAVRRRLAEEEAVRLEAERRRVEDARKLALESAITFANSLAPSLKNSIGMEMILIKPGEFRMGSDDGNERPVHTVTILRPFYLGKYEVTQVQWRAVMGYGYNRSTFKGDNLPVERVSFDEAQEFCRKLSLMTGEQYRLPTEAEWEYACRAGTTGPYAGDFNSMTWYSLNSAYHLGDLEGERTTHPVGQKQPNAFGLYDMHGNVSEWCEDIYHKNYYGAPSDGSAWLGGGDSDGYRVLRGDSVNGNNECCRSAARSGGGHSYHGKSFGVRVAMLSRTP